VAGIEKVAAFGQLSANGRALLARGVVVHNFPKGKTIIEKGQGVSGAYFVLDGRLRVFTYSPSGKEATLYLLDPGETCILALNSMFNNLLYPAWVETQADTAVAVVPGPLYRALFEAEKSVQDLTVHTLSTLVFRLMAELEEVHSCTLDQRLASFLLTRASDCGVVAQTQQDIADHMGTTREVVARIMARLAARGVIDTRRGEVTILQAPLLAEMVKGS
jgi:CRP/FNR family transcriptional regulator, anaerobic regulatory protein